MNEQIKGTEFLIEDSIQETMIGSLWSRTTFSKKYPYFLQDPKLLEILDHMIYDFDKFQEFPLILNGQKKLVRL